MSLEPQDKSFDWISDGFILAFMTATVYAICFAYERGVADFFGISVELIGISQSLLTNSFAVICGLIFCLNFAIFVWQFSPRKDTELAQAVRHFIGLSLLICLPYAPGIYYEGQWKWFLGIELVLFLTNFGLPSIFQVDKKGPLNKIKATIQTEKDTFKHTLMGVFDRLGFLKIIQAVVVVMLVSLSAYNFAFEKTKHKTEYYLLGDGFDEIVLAIYDEKIITAHFDNNKHLIEGPISIQKIADDKKLIIKKVKTGRVSIVF